MPRRIKSEAMRRREEREAARHRAATYLPDLLNAAAELTGTHMAVIQVRPTIRSPEAVRARWAVMHVLREQGLSLVAIARLLDLDHTTVMNGLARIAEDPDLFVAADTIAYNLHQNGRVA